jgi:hypothetical protein
MRSNGGRVQRQGRIYRFSIDGMEYAAFIWQLGKQFHGRIEGHPQIPISTARTALAVRDALQQSIATRATPR